MDIALNLIFALVLVLLNAFFVLSEFAIVKVRRTQLRELAEQGDRRAILALHITKNLNAYLSANQLGITLASIGLGWLGEPAFARLVESVLSWANLDLGQGLHVVSFAISYAVVTFLHTVIGELAPKTIAIQVAKPSALFSAYPLHWFFLISYPAIWLLNGAANQLVRLLGFHTVTETQEVHNKEELRMILTSSYQGGALEHRSWALLEKVFDFSQRLAREIMTPKHDVICLDAGASLQDNIGAVKEDQHIRYPVYQGHPDNIIGIIHIQNLFDAYTDEGATNLIELVQEPLIVPETASAHDLRQRFQKLKTELAIVVDEYGSFLGIVTMEDLVEEIFGEFRDELDDETDPIYRQDDAWLMEANVLVDDVFLLLEIDEEQVETAPGIDTIGGYIFAILGRQPETGDQVDVDGYTFEVLAVSGFGVSRLKAARKHEESETEE